MWIIPLMLAAAVATPIGLYPAYGWNGQRRAEVWGLFGAFAVTATLPFLLAAKILYDIGV